MLQSLSKFEKATRKEDSMYYNLYVKNFGVAAADEMWRTRGQEDIEFSPEERANLRKFNNEGV